MSITEIIDRGEKRLTSHARYTLIIEAIKQIIIPGHVLEFGVGAGNSIRCIAREINQKIYGFDSFEGLPEEWHFTPHVIFAKGSFKYDPPEVNENIELIHGLFADTIPIWKEQNIANIAFLHIDSDLYSSCATVLTKLNDLIKPGTIILFDELIGYPNWEEGEWKAMQEWLQEYDREAFQLDTNHTQALYRVVK